MQRKSENLSEMPSIFMAWKRKKKRSVFIQMQKSKRLMKSMHCERK